MRFALLWSGSSAHTLLLSLTPFPHPWSNKTPSIQVWLWHRDGPWCIPRQPSLVSATWGACNLHVPRPGPQNHRTWGKSLSVMKSCAIWPCPLCMYFLVTAGLRSWGSWVSAKYSSHLGNTNTRRDENTCKEIYKMLLVWMSVGWQVISVFTFQWSIWLIFLFLLWL